MKSMMSAGYPPLNFQLRAELFSQLAAMEGAGLQVDKALGVTRLPPREQPRVANMLRWLGLGLDMAEAGLRGGLFTPLEASLLHAACSAGSPERTYRSLSEYYARKAAHLAAMKSRMMMPLCMILIAVFVRPLPKLVAGSLTPGGYLLGCLLPLAALGGLAYLLVEMPRRLPSDSPLSKNLPFGRVLTLMPLFGSMAVRRSVRDFCESLALLLDAGMPIMQALPLSVNTIRSERIKQQFGRIKPRIEAGASFAQAIGEIAFVGHGNAHAMILAGETSGALPDVLFRYAASETMAINLFDDMVAEWAPRLVYTLVAVWIGYGIIQSGAFMPSLPPDLR